MIVPEAVVDQLEAVDVEEEHAYGAGLVGSVECLVELLHQEDSVCEVGQRVVVRLMQKVELELLAVGDIEQRPGDVGQARVRRKGEPRRDPPHGSVGAHHAIRVFDIGRPIQRGGEHRLDAAAVVGMDATFEHLEAGWRRGVEAEDHLQLVGAGDRLRGDVELEAAEVRRALRVGEPAAIGLLPRVRAACAR